MASHVNSAVESSTFGAIYGTITVLSVLIAHAPPIADPFKLAVVLFGAVLAVALAEAFADICKLMMDTGQTAAWADFKLAWQHSSTVLLAASLPSVCMLLAVMNLLSNQAAYTAAHIAAIATLTVFGARIGWKAKRTIWSLLAGALTTALIGMLISSMKYFAH